MQHPETCKNLFSAVVQSELKHRIEIMHIAEKRKMSQKRPWLYSKKSLHLVHQFFIWINSSHKELTKKEVKQSMEKIKFYGIGGQGAVTAAKVLSVAVSVHQNE